MLEPHTKPNEKYTNTHTARVTYFLQEYQPTAEEEIRSPHTTIPKLVQDDK